jgi:hypothetical protein
VTNTLDYHGKEIITAVKSFIVQALDLMSNDSIMTQFKDQSYKIFFTFTDTPGHWAKVLVPVEPFQPILALIKKDYNTLSASS